MCYKWISTRTKCLKISTNRKGQTTKCTSEGIIVIESTINGGSFHTVNYGFNQNKIVACYKHNQHYLNIKTAKGNIKLLQNEEVLPIYDKESLDEFLKRVDSFYKYKNSQIYKEKTEQIQFKFLN